MTRCGRNRHVSAGNISQIGRFASILAYLFRNGHRTRGTHLIPRGMYRALRGIPSGRRTRKPYRWIRKRRFYPICPAKRKSSTPHSSNRCSRWCRGPYDKTGSPASRPSRNGGGAYTRRRYFHENRKWSAWAYTRNDSSVYSRAGRSPLGISKRRRIYR